MNTDESRRNVAVYRNLHPAIGHAMIGSVIWSVAALWTFFDDGGPTTLSLIVVAGFALAFVGIPLILWRASPRPNPDSPVSLGIWLDGEFESGETRISCKAALVLALLLPVAAAFGFTIIAFVAFLVAHGAL